MEQINNNELIQSQFHNGSITTHQPELLKYSAFLVSIPQWFDYNSLLLAFSNENEFTSQFHNGSITTEIDNLSVNLVNGSQFHNGSITTKALLFQLMFSS